MDRLDKKILAVLQANARASLQEIGEGGHSSWEMWTERARAKRDKTHWNERLHLVPVLLPLVQSCFSTGNARRALDAPVDCGIPAIDSSRHLYRGARLWQGPARLSPGGELVQIAFGQTSHH